MKTQCKLSYPQLKEMLARANYNHDVFWSLGLYDQSFRYTKIAQRILEAICRIPAENLRRGG